MISNKLYLFRNTYELKGITKRRCDVLNSEEEKSINLKN